MDEYIKNLLKLIRGFRYDNTYKIVWIKSIVSLCADRKTSEIPLSEIAEKVFPLYWNLHIHFDPEGKTLRQGSNYSKPPEILQYVLQKIAEYKTQKGKNFKPVFFETMNKTDVKRLSIDYMKVVSTLKKDVAYRFLNLGSNKIPVYELVNDNNTVSLTSDQVRLISEHADVLTESIQLRWIKILEEFNPTTPRIAAKVSLSLDNNSRRKSLAKFRPILDIENPGRICNECDLPIAEGDLSIDHVIPWSFLYSDNLWNLVYTHKSCNSSKSNVSPDSQKIKQLEARNIKLCELMEVEYHPSSGKKDYQELKAAINESLVEKMWTLYRGY